MRALRRFGHIFATTDSSGALCEAVVYQNRAPNVITWCFRSAGRLGNLGLKIKGGRDRPVVPGDPGIFITAVRRGSLLQKVIGPGDKILKVSIVDSIRIK